MADGKKHITLALQGGGAHGAFTWGVLDRLLDDDRLLVEGISGTSAGAMNGALVVWGMAQGGPQAARALLEKFWHRIGESGRFSIFQPTPMDRLFGNPANLDLSPFYQGFDLMTRLLSPYQFNPQNKNPLKEALAEMIDFDKVREGEGVKLFISTTNVRTGKIRVFRNHELTADVLLASACLPHLFQAVEVDGEHYWDGGFMGNPAMFPLIYNCRASDILLIEINPIRIEQLPETSRAIADRMNAISFNATMMREMRTIAFVTRLLERHRLTARSGLRRIFFHMVQAEEEMAAFGVSSKYNLDFDFLLTLRDLGRRKADEWLKVNFDQLGRDSSVDLEKLFF
ncbi:MAG: patatin-like phospholipase family protein [Alphaproteobacteria bacterium]|nr:patatin-like phospholipase family protein [Alphaproteobacteria bacterium]